MILSIIVLLDILAALSALMGLADFLDTAEVLAKIVLKEDKKGKGLEDGEGQGPVEIILNTSEKFLGTSNNTGTNRELLKTTIGEGRSKEIKADPVDNGQSDLIYLMNSTGGELQDSREEVAITYNRKQNMYKNRIGDSVFTVLTQPVSQVMVFAAEAFGFGIVLIANLTAIQGFSIFIWNYACIQYCGMVHIVDR